MYIVENYRHPSTDSVIDSRGNLALLAIRPSLRGGEGLSGMWSYALQIPFIPGYCVFKYRTTFIFIDYHEQLVDSPGRSMLTYGTF